MVVIRGNDIVSSSWIGSFDVPPYGATALSLGDEAPCADCLTGMIEAKRKRHVSSLADHVGLVGLDGAVRMRPVVEPLTDLGELTGEGVGRGVCWS